MKKKVFCSLFSVILVLVYLIMPSAEVYAQDSVQGMEEYQEFVQEELTTNAEEYLEGELETIRALIASCGEELEINMDSTAGLQLGKPFVIYALDREIQEESVYYPLVDERNEEIKAVVTVVNTTEGWQYTISEDWAEKLNGADYLDQDYLFYQKEGNITAQSGTRKIILNGGSVRDTFDDKSIMAKEKLIKKQMKKWKKLDTKRSKKMPRT